MVESIWKDLKKEFSYGNMVTRIIIVNVAVFILVNIIKLLLTVSAGFENSPAFDNFYKYLALSGDLWFDLTHPWVFLTHMFLHQGFFHILWNMLFLYWFGQIVGDFIGNQRILPLYLLGGLAGAIAYLVFANIAYNGGGYAYGASGAVNAIIVAAAVISPDYIIRLLFLGNVKLKYIAAVVVLLSIIGIADLNNTGGNIAHLGGALFGWFFILKLREGSDMAVPINRFLSKIANFFKNIPATSKSSSKKGPRVVYKNTSKKQRKAVSDQKELSHQERIDAILDKMRETGFEGLSKEEKDYLFNASDKKQ